MLTSNKIGVISLYVWEHLIINNLELSLTLFETRCLQSYYFFTSLILLQLLILTCHDFLQIVLFPFIIPCAVLLYSLVYGPAVCKSGNRVPWSAPVARVHPQTADHRKMTLKVRVQPDNKHGNGIGRVDM